ncbi:outer membrane protein [Beijerinckia sp. L45]|uniref:outer membrane protein n=1 Tax=Beijerinckia sp. L45 TaxID=1641855 RepID=UPI00131DA799|nr:outer membrane beta-barrel protein [Beijerinckia sp. L45]
MSQRNFVLSVLTLGLLSPALAPSLARAADLDAPYIGSQQFPEDKVEFGSGWYIRGDLGATRLPSMQISAPNLPTNIASPLPNAPTALFGNGSALGYDASLGGGYQLNKWFRTDLIADFHKPISTSATAGGGKIFCPTAVSYPTDPATGLLVNNPTYASGGCTANETGKLSSYDVLLNAYIDLGTWYGVTPYVGAGAGLAFGHYSTSATYTQANNAAYHITYTDAFFGTTFAPNYDRAASGTYYSFAYALMAGFAVDIYDHTKLDIGYRYLNLGKIPGVSGTLSSNEIRAGVRYMIDE